MGSKNEMDILLEWFSPDRKEAERLLEDARKKLLFIFRSWSDREDLVGEAIMRTLKNIKDGKVKNFRGKPLHYISTTARRIKSELIRERQKQKDFQEFEELKAETKDNPLREEQSQIFDECVKNLPLDDKELLMDYTLPPEGVSQKDHRREVAERWQLTINNLRVKICRIKETLSKCTQGKLSKEE